MTRIENPKRPCAAVSLVESLDARRILCVWNKRYVGWSLPGGLVEDGESVEDFRVTITGPPCEQEIGCPVTWLTAEEFLQCSPFADFYRPMFARGTRLIGAFGDRGAVFLQAPLRIECTCDARSASMTGLPPGTDPHRPHCPMHKRVTPEEAMPVGFFNPPPLSGK